MTGSTLAGEAVSGTAGIVVRRLRTAHGTTVLARRRDGVMCHRVRSDPADYVEVAACFPAGQDDTCFLVACGDGVLDLAMAGEELSLAALPYAVVVSDTPGVVSLRHPSTDLYLTAVPRADDEDGILAAHGKVPAGWEMFEFAESVPPPPPAEVIGALSRVRWSPAGHPEPDDLLAIRYEGAADAAVAIALCRLLPAEQLGRLVPTLVRSPVYDRLFPMLQKKLRGDEPVFPFNSRKLMEAGIRHHGWEIGEHSYGAPEIVDPDFGSLRIGRYCSIAGQVQVIVANHTTRTSTTYPFTALRQWWPNASAEVEDHHRAHVEIGHAVWIGTRACILPGTRVGHGSIIGAHAVARGDIAPFSVVVGNPGRVVRRLFDDATIERLLAVAWWDWPDERVDRFIPLLTGPDTHAFLAAAEAELGIGSTGSA